MGNLAKVPPGVLFAAIEALDGLTSTVRRFCSRVILPRWVDRMPGDYWAPHITITVRLRRWIPMLDRERRR